MSAPPPEQQKLQLAVAKAAFSATLSAPGEAKVPTQAVAQFISLLSTVASHSSQRNVKEARKWLLEHCNQAKQVTAAIRLISAFANTLNTFKERISLIYVLNDALYHATNTYKDTKSYFPSAILQYLPALIKSIQAAPNAHFESLDKVSRIWSDKNYFTEDEYSQIFGERPNQSKESTHAQKESEPLVLPNTLGNEGDPHYLLPVSCMVEVMEYPHNYKPVPPLSVKAIRLSSKIDPEVLKLVESFESHLDNWSFTEEVGSEGEEFDGEGWNLKFWRERASLEQKKNEQRQRLGDMQKLRLIRQGMGMRDSRKYSHGSRSRSRSASPPRRPDGSRSRSPQDNWVAPAPPPDRGGYMSSHTILAPPSGPAYPPTQPPYQYPSVSQMFPTQRGSIPPPPSPWQSHAPPSNDGSSGRYTSRDPRLNRR